MHSQPNRARRAAATNQLISGCQEEEQPRAGGCDHAIDYSRGHLGIRGCPLFRDLLNWPPLHYLSVPQLR